MDKLRGRVALVAAYATQQGKHPGKSAWDLGISSFKGALAESAVRRDDIDGLLTQVSQDGSGQMEPARFASMLGMRPRVSSALTYGTAAFTLPYACGLIASGQCQVVACVYATNQRTGGFRFAEASDPWGSPYGFLNPAGLGALGLSRYLHVYGREKDRDLLGAVAINQRRYAQLNPIAYRRDPMSWEDYCNDRWIVWPLRRSDICLITDGGVCLVLADADWARQHVERPVYVLGIGRDDGAAAHDDASRLLVPHMRNSAAMVQAMSGCHPSDVHALYVQDAQSTAVLLTLENYGFCAPGEALDFIQDGRIGPGGVLPLNTNGGQLSEGYMVGWLHQVEIFRQLRGEADERQVDDCRIAQFCGTGRIHEYTSSIIYGNEL